jgi:hypothetical protein
MEEIKIAELYLDAVHIGKLQLRIMRNSAQQSVQLTAFGAGWRARLGYYLILWGCRLSKLGGN